MGLSTKPYLIRAIHEWCTDSGYRAYIAVSVDSRTVVPREFVRGGEIVLNVSPAATNRLHIGNELIEFEARFGGVARAVSIPVDNVSAIYAQETGQGMAFEVPKPLALEPGQGAEDAPDSPVAGSAAEPPAAADAEAAASQRRPGGRPKLRAVPSPAEPPPEAGEKSASEEAEPLSGGAQAPTVVSEPEAAPPESADGGARGAGGSDKPASRRRKPSPRTGPALSAVPAADEQRAPAAEPGSDSKADGQGADSAADVPGKKRRATRTPRKTSTDDEASGEKATEDAPKAPRARTPRARKPKVDASAKVDASEAPDVGASSATEGDAASTTAGSPPVDEPPRPPRRGPPKLTRVK